MNEQSDVFLSFPEQVLAVIDPSGARVAAVVLRSFANILLHVFDSTTKTARNPAKHDISVTEISSLALARGGDLLAIIGRPHIYSLRLATRALIVRDLVHRFDCFDAATDAPIEELAFSPDGRRIAVSERCGSHLKLFDIHAGKRPVLLNHQDCRRMIFSTGNSFLAAVGQWVTVWDVETKQPIAQFRGQDEDVPDMAFSPDERHLAIARTDGAVEFWDFRKSRLVRSYSWDIGRLSAIAFAPDGLTCAVAGQGGKIVVWDVDV